MGISGIETGITVARLAQGEEQWLQVPRGKRSEALAVDISCTGDELTVVLADGRTVSAPVAWFPRLLAATRKQREDWELIGGGIGIHWESIDEDISIASLLQPENFVRMPPMPLQPTRKKRLVKVRRQRARG